MTDTPGRLRYSVFIDDASVDGKAKHFGFGTLWMPWQRRGDISRELQALRERHHYPHEIKWEKVSKKYLGFYLDLVDWFFGASFAAFHCMVVHQPSLDLAKHGGRIEVAREKAATLLLSNKTKRFLTVHPDREAEIRVYVDPLPTSRAKADEVMQIITGHVIRAAMQRTDLDLRVFTKDSKEVTGIQLCDLLLGAVLDGFNRRSSSEPKDRLRRHVAAHLGWEDIDADTFPEEPKFNIWHLWKERRVWPVETRAVRLSTPPRHPEGM